MENVHRFLLNYLPLAGYAAWAILNGFEDKLFLPILLSGWIVMLVYQIIISAIYTPPRFILLAIGSLALTPVFLFLNSFLAGNDYAIIFIETTAVALMSCILALIGAFIMKAVKEGLPPEVRFPVVFTIGLLGVAGYFIGKLFYRFFESYAFDRINIAVVAFGICVTSLYFFNRMHQLTNRFSGTIGTGKKNEFPVSGILITLAVWIIIVPLAMWIKRLLA